MSNVMSLYGAYGGGTITPDYYKDMYDPGWRQREAGVAAGKAAADRSAMIGAVKSGSDFSGYQSQLNNLLNDPNSIKNSPAYQFNLQQGTEAINRSAAARGMGASGNVLAELQKYGSGLASQEYGNQFNRLADLMKNAQSFGVNAGYYAPPKPTGTISTPGGMTTYLPQPGYFNTPGWGS